MPVATFHTTNKPRSNWKKEQSAYTSDDIINAYLKGREDGESARFRVLIQQFEKNVLSAQEVSEKLIKKAEENNIVLREIHLKADSIDNFEALFVAEKNDFISDHFRIIYSNARKLKNDVQNENFYISFSFMPSSENLNQKRLNSDGYFLKYVNKE